MKIDQKSITDSGVFAASALAGGMAGRVVADKLKETIKKTAIRHGLLGLVGVAVAALATPKDMAGKAMQGAGVGLAAAQFTDALKAILTDDGKKPFKDDSIMKPALGAPESETVYVTVPQHEYYPYEDVPSSTNNTSTQAVGFLSAADYFAES